MLNFKKQNCLILILAILGFNLLFQTCKKNNPCDIIICQNGGVCKNGICDCPIGYTGADCKNIDIDIDIFQIQELLDLGKVTPFTLTSGGIPLDSLYGRRYKGGLIFYVNNTDRIGMVAAPTQLDDGHEGWGCWGLGIGKTSTDIGTGLQNSILIAENCFETPPNGPEAGVTCINLILNEKEDWFLPSKDELNLMYTNLQLKGYGNFNDDPSSYIHSAYWSSSEMDSNNGGADAAWIQIFSDGTQMRNSKRNANHFRPVRFFQ